VYVSSNVYDAMRYSRQFTSAAEVTVDGVAHPVWRLVERKQ
jgi:hypothetical protein